MNLLRFYYYIFLQGFCDHILLPIMVLFVLALLFGQIGTGYGVRWLVRHEVPMKQAVVGFLLGLLLVKTLFVGYLLEGARNDAHSLFNLYPGPDWDLSRLWIYLGGIAVSFPVLLLVLGGILWLLNSLVRQRVRPASVAQPPAPPVWPLIVGVTAAFAGFVTLMIAVQTVAQVQTHLAYVGRWFLNFFDVQNRVIFRPETEAMHGVAFYSSLATALFYFVLVPLLWRNVSPIAALGGLLNAGMGLYGYLSFYLPGWVPLLVLLGLVLLALGGVSLYKVRFPTMDYRNLAPLSKYPMAPTAGGVVLLPTGGIGWTPKRPLVVLCVSGGGLRATLWAVAMLAELERQFATKGVSFPYHIRIVTGASGGMAGAAYYIATLQPPDITGKVARKVPLDQLTRTAGDDCLSRVVYRMFYGDMYQAFLPFPLIGDRGQALEQAWAKNFDGALSVPFTSLTVNEKAGWCPSLIMSPMLVEDGRRLLVSNLDLSNITHNQGNNLSPKGGPFSLEAVEFFRLFPQSVNFPLSTAARMSASFPFFAPAAVLPTVPRRRVVDAGYFDNYGVTVAAAWLFHNRGWVLANASSVVLIQIRDGASAAQRLDPAGAGARSTVLSRGVEFFTSPIQGAGSARDWSQSFRDDEQLQMLSEVFAPHHKPGGPYFTIATFEYPGEASLSWYLTQNEQNSILSGVNNPTNTQAMADLLAWW
jgi:hypothetical protein